MTKISSSVKGVSFLVVAILRLKSGSLWTAVLLHTTHNIFIQGVFDRLSGNTAITPHITGEFGVGLALTRLVVAYFFWRTQRDKSLQTRPLQAQPVVHPEQSGAA